MKKNHAKGISILLTAALGTGLLAGCGSGSSSASSGSASGEGAQELSVCMWDSMFSEDAIHAFEEETGCTVNITYIDNTDTMLSRLIADSSQYDVCDIETAYVKSFVESGLLQEIDHSAIDNEQYVEPSLMETGPIGDEDMQYVVPDSNANYTTIVYNTETCPIEITSFEDLADPALEGEIAMVNSTISLYGAALSALGYEPDTVNEDEISAANDLLIEIKKNVKTFVGESAVSALESGECSVALCWDYSILCFDNEENWDRFAIADIDSDYEQFIQYWGITATSEKKDLAQEFINYMISPEAVAMHVESFGMVPMVQREYIEEYLPEGFYDNPCISVYSELADKCWTVAVDDEQIGIMDTYYTLLMGGN